MHLMRAVVVSSVLTFRSSVVLKLDSSLPNLTTHFVLFFTLHSCHAVVLPIQIAALLMTMVRKSIISAGAWHYYYTLSLLSNYIVGPIAGWFNPAGNFHY